MAICRKVLESDPENDDAYRMLVDLAANAPLAIDSAARTAAHRELDRDFIEFQSKRFILLSDAAAAQSQARLDLLERTHHQFERFAARLGLKPLPLQNKQVCILFAKHEDYVAFAKKLDNLTNQGISGYYSPQHDWVVFDDAQSLPGVAQQRLNLEPLRQDVEDLGRAAREAGNGDSGQTLRANLAQARKILDEQTRRVDDLARKESIATTVHECTHQLLFHARVQSPYVHSPLWICEGLATNFETDAPQSAFGPDQEYTPRRRRFAMLLEEGRLLRLSELVQVIELPADNADRIDVIYQQSYALVKWMCRFRRTELRNYLFAMLSQPPGDIQPAQQLSLFQQCFGDVDAVEKAWLRFETSKAREASRATAAAAE